MWLRLSIPFVVVLFSFLSACGPAATATSAPTTSAPAATQSSGLITIQEQFAQIDKVLSQSMKSSFAYNSPSSMKLDETATLELLLNPSATTEELGNQITESGTVNTGVINITPQMKAELIAQDPEAFSIRSIPEDPIQLISTTDTTKWQWLVTARKGGTHTLTLIIYRLIQFQGQDYWREVETYKANIYVNVTIAQMLGSIDWKWFLGLLLTAIAIPAFWRWMDQRKKQTEEVEKKKEDKKEDKREEKKEER